MRFIVLSLLLGCTSWSSEECEIVPLDSGSGQVRGAIAFRSGNPRLEYASGSITCEACNEQLVLDPHLAIVARHPVAELVDPAEPGEDIYDREVRRAGGIIYVLRADDRAQRAAFDVTAYAEDHRELWRVDFGQPLESLTLTAGVEGAYVKGALVQGDGGPVGVTALAPDGTIRWTLPPVQHLRLDGAGGVFTWNSQHSSTGIAVATLTHVDALGATHWTRSFTAWQPGPYGATARIFVVDPTPEGIVVAGEFFPSLDLGDQVLAPSGADENNFVAVLDGAGATKWAAPLGPARDNLENAVSHGGDVWLSGDMGSDAFVSRITPAGIASTLVIGGVGNQSPRQHIVTDDTIYTEVSSQRGNTLNELENNQLEIDGRSFDFDEATGAHYLFAIAR